MYALVRFLEGHDPHMRHVIGVSDIQDFRPADTSDFDNKSIYDAFWREGVEDNYSAQVLALGKEKSRTSSDSDGPPAHDSEMRQAENSFWKERCRLLQEDNLFLQEQLKGYQRFSAPKSFKQLDNHCSAQKKRKKKKRQHCWAEHVEGGTASESCNSKP
ncbi:unnamed protein product [Ixodes pacificus]